MRFQPQLRDSGLDSASQVASKDDNVAGDNGCVGNGVAIEQVNDCVGAATDQAWAKRVGDVVNDGTGDHGHDGARLSRACDPRRDAILHRGGRRIRLLGWRRRRTGNRRGLGDWSHTLAARDHHKSSR